MIIQHLSRYIPEVGKLLWVVDENALVSAHDISVFKERSLVLTNRYDVYSRFVEQGIKTEFSDFSLNSDAKFDCVIYAVSKEKLVSMHVIASSSACLHQDGTLLLVGKKNEGIKSYFNKLSIAGAKNAELQKCGQYYISRSSPPPSLEIHIETYREMVNIATSENFILLGKPGVFGWQKIDQGSKLLMDTIASSHSELKEKDVLDLGCGNGYLSLRAFTLGADYIFATDNNAAALNATKENFRLNHIRGEVSADDCGGNITRTFDLVLCNPPFHKGYAISPQLTDNFLQATKRLLNKTGEAWFVVNAFIPLERNAKSLFRSVETICNNKQFKVLCLRH